MVRMKFPFPTKLLSLLLSFVIICNIVKCETKGSCNQKDKQILLCFKHGLIDQSGMLSTWSNKQDCCEWRGVVCDMNGRVTNLTLPCSADDYIIDYTKSKAHCLGGNLHLSLFELELLTYLDLSNNNFKAIQFSSDCQNLSLVNTLDKNENFSNVVYLDLSENENLVIHDLRWLLSLTSSLKYLNLNSIDLHKQVQWVQILTRLPLLSELYLSNCLLESVSMSVQYANFTSLEYLDISGNNLFSELPTWLFNITGLSFLNLGENNFHGQIPKQLRHLRNLHSLNLKTNRMSGTIPDWLGQLGKLEYLSLYGNLFNGSIPISLANLSSLSHLDVASNNLSGILPPGLGNLSSLNVLGVGENYLSGVVTHQNFAKLFNLKRLFLSSPFFIFDFDPHWIPPFILEYLLLEYADLKLIPWLHTQTSLDYLEINYSLFKNVSQEMFWSLANQCMFLSLGGNDMPWDMSNVLLNSEIVWLVRNGLNGGLPRVTSNVSVLKISNNNLSGSLSPILCHNMTEKSNLRSLNVFDNLLSGSLTECWKNCKSLVHVNLGRNNLTGMIPRSMGTLSNLMSLHISNTKLHGEIPVSLKKCKQLLILNLRGNKFSGMIPNWFEKHVRVLLLRSNEFSGDIPLQICQLSSLLVLDLASNRLTGTIPHCLHNITAMISNNASQSDEFGIGVLNRFLSINFQIKVPLQAKGNDLIYQKYMCVMDFSNNNLSGRIPLQVSSLTALQSLNLSQNQLMGTIPEEIGNMKALESLDFSNNTLSGEIPQTMSALSFLEVLNLSFNNFRGQIPLGTQLQGFSNLSYIGNPELCGTPLIKKCNHSEVLNGDTKLIESDEEGSELMEWFYMGMGVGFATGFWIVFGTLLFKRTWRHAYFNFLYDVKDWFKSRWL